MTVKDSCFILHRFRSGENNLIAKVYCKRLGQRNLFVREYFLFKTFKVGTFEPFNFIDGYFSSINGYFQPIDLTKVAFLSKKISQNFYRFEFMTKVSKAVLKFVRYPDDEIFELLKRATEIDGFFNFNFARFLLNLSNLLGFSIQNLNRAGWVNILDLGSCSKEDIGKGYCIFIHPRVLSTLKVIAEENSKPYEISKRDMEKIEKFFNRFLTFQVDNF